MNRAQQFFEHRLKFEIALYQESRNLSNTETNNKIFVLLYYITQSSTYLLHIETGLEHRFQGYKGAENVRNLGCLFRLLSLLECKYINSCLECLKHFLLKLMAQLHVTHPKCLNVLVALRNSHLELCMILDMFRGNPNA